MHIFGPHINILIYISIFWEKTFFVFSLCERKLLYKETSRADRVTDSSTPPGVEVQVSDSASLLKDVVHDEHGKILGFSVSSDSDSDSNLSDKVFKTPAAVIRARRFGDCTRCFGTDHNRFNCKFAIRCAGCFKLGHKFRYCKLKSWPIYRWQPKTVSLNTEPT
jgi:hypothetical protein